MMAQTGNQEVRARMTLRQLAVEESDMGCRDEGLSEDGADGDEGCFLSDHRTCAFLRSMHDDWHAELVSQTQRKYIPFCGVR